MTRAGNSVDTEAKRNSILRPPLVDLLVSEVTFQSRVPSVDIAGHHFLHIVRAKNSFWLLFLLSNKITQDFSSHWLCN
jgi:hypothetical protein